MIIANQWKHGLVGFGLGLTLGLIHWLIEKTPGAEIHLWWWMVAVFAMVVINVERNQMKAAVYDAKQVGKPITPNEYWRKKWLDAVLDVVVGLVGFVLGLLPFWMKMGALG